MVEKFPSKIPAVKNCPSCGMPEPKHKKSCALAMEIIELLNKKGDTKKLEEIKKNLVFSDFSLSNNLGGEETLDGEQPFDVGGVGAEENAPEVKIREDRYYQKDGEYFCRECWSSHNERHKENCGVHKKETEEFIADFSGRGQSYEHIEGKEKKFVPPVPIVVQPFKAGHHEEKEKFILDEKLSRTKNLLMYDLEKLYNFITGGGKEKFSEIIRETKQEQKSFLESLTTNLGDDLLEKKVISEHYNNFIVSSRNTIKETLSKPEFSLSEDDKKKIISYIIENIKNELFNISQKDPEVIDVIKKLLEEYLRLK